MDFLVAVLGEGRGGMDAIGVDGVVVKGQTLLHREGASRLAFGGFYRS